MERFGEGGGVKASCVGKVVRPPKSRAIQYSLSSDCAALVVRGDGRRIDRPGDEKKDVKSKDWAVEVECERANESDEEGAGGTKGGGTKAAVAAEERESERARTAV